MRMTRSPTRRRGRRLRPHALCVATRRCPPCWSAWRGAQAAATPSSRSSPGRPESLRIGEAAFTLRSSGGGAERLHRGAEPLVVAGGRTRGGQPRNVDLGNEPAFRHLSDQPLAAATGNEFGEELAIEHVPVARFGHELAASVPYYDDAAFLERAQRLAHDASADTELPLQVLLAGKPLARLILAGEDRAEHEAHLFAMQTHRGDPIIRRLWLVGVIPCAAADLVLWLGSSATYRCRDQAARLVVRSLARASSWLRSARVNFHSNGVAICSWRRSIERWPRCAEPLSMIRNTRLALR